VVAKKDWPRLLASEAPRKVHEHGIKGGSYLGEKHGTSTLRCEARRDDNATIRLRHARMRPKGTRGEEGKTQLKLEAERRGVSASLVFWGGGEMWESSAPKSPRWGVQETYRSTLGKGRKDKKKKTQKT